MCVWITRAFPAIVQTLSGVGEGAQPAQAPARALLAAPRATGSSSAACPERPPSHERWEPRRPLCSRPGIAPYRLPPHRRRRGAGRPSPPSYSRCPDRVQIPIPSPPGAARPRQQRLPRHGTCCRPAVAAPRRRLAAVGGRCGGWRLGLCAGLCAGPQRCLRTDSSGAAAAAGARAGEGGSGTRGPGAESVTGGGPGGGRERGRGGGGGAMGLGDAATASSGSASGRRGRSVSTGTGRGRGEMRRCEKAGLGAPLPSREERVLATGTVGLCSSHSPRQRLRRQREAGAAPCAAPLPAQAAGGSTGGVTGR